MTLKKLNRMKSTECTLNDIINFSPRYEWTVNGKFVTAVNNTHVFLREFSPEGELGDMSKILHAECTNMMKYKNSDRDTLINIHGDD